jgi:endonuclease III
LKLGAAPRCLPWLEAEIESRTVDDQFSMTLAERAIKVHTRLHNFYGVTTWHNSLPPVDELVATILSQNTNDTNSDRAFTSLCKRFPSWEAVRDAEPSQVIDSIRQAGLANLKGPRIQAVLREITAQRGSIDLEFLRDMPVDEARAWLTNFKGVGLKTSAIVLLFSLGKPAFPVDTHIYRVTGRLGLRPAKMSVEQAHSHLEALFPPETYYAAHINLIHLGREICQSRRPLCPQCPLQDLCVYYAEHNRGTNI